MLKRDKNTTFIMMNYSDYISIDSTIRFGRPCLKKTRISVYDVLGWLAEGKTHEQIISDFPEVTEQGILACLSFVADREHKYRIAS